MLGKLFSSNIFIGVVIGFIGGFLFHGTMKTIIGLGLLFISLGIFYLYYKEPS